MRKKDTPKRIRDAKPRFPMARKLGILAAALVISLAASLDVFAQYEDTQWSVSPDECGNIVIRASVVSEVSTSIYDFETMLSLHENTDPIVSIFEGDAAGYDKKMTVSGLELSLHLGDNYGGTVFLDEITVETETSTVPFTGEEITKHYLVIKVKPQGTGELTINARDMLNIGNSSHTVIPEDTPTVSAPSGTNATVNETGEAVVTWMDPGGDFSGINIEGNGSSASVDPGMETWTDPNVNATGESYRIQAFLAKTGCTFTSDWVTVDVPEAPGVIKPSNLQASTDRCDGVVHLTWNYNGEVEPSEFRIRRDGSVIGSVNGDVWEYDDPVGEFESHSYQVQAVGILAGDETDWTSETEGITTGYPGKPELLSAEQVGSSIEVDWTASAYTDTYLLVRNSAGGSVEIEVEGATSYTDNQVNGCELYRYELYAANGCTNRDGTRGIKADGYMEEKVTPYLASYITTFDASKAYFPDKVVLEWEVEEDNLSLVDEFVIKRRKAGNTEYKSLATVDGQATYEDRSAVGGLLYEYLVVGKLTCDEEIVFSNESEAVGFRKPYGIVSGNVSYENGVNVKGAEVLAEKAGSATGTSLYLDGSSSVTVADQEKLTPGEFLAVEAWIRGETVSGTAGVIDKYDGTNGYRLSRSGDDLVFGVNVSGSWRTVTAPGSLNTGEWTHVAGVYDSTGLKIYVNGRIPFTTTYLLEESDTSSLREQGIDAGIIEMLGSMYGTSYSDFGAFRSDLVDAVGQNQAERLVPLLLPLAEHEEAVPGTTYAVSGPIVHSGGPLVLGDGFRGNLDEIRIWNRARDEEDVQYDYKRVVASDAEGIAAYWRCDENFGDYIYDVSKSGGEFHKNDGLKNGAAWSDDIPSSGQLGWMGKTDKNGNYTIPYIPYIGSGENFTLTPRYDQHQFDPNSTTIFLGEGSAVLNGQDFEDVSSFKVTGTVFYEGTTCGVEGAIIGVDGEPVIRDGQPVYTDQFGEFEISVPVGEHYINVIKTHHAFRSAKFPPGPSSITFNFQEPVNGINFIDQTTVRVTGRVVGGTREGDKKPGLGLSKNNIGVAAFDFESATGCTSYHVETDPATGEYTLDVPPMPYVIKDFEVPKNPQVANYFSEFPEADFSVIKPEQTVTQTYSGAVDAVITIDTVSLTATLDIDGVDSLITVEPVDLINGGYDARFLYQGDPHQYALDTDSTVTIVETSMEGNNQTDTATYNYRYDLIYRTPPQIRVTASDSVTPFRGELTVRYQDPATGAPQEFDLEANPLSYPCFVQGNDYGLVVHAEEVYYNQDVCEGINGCDDAMEDRVPVDDGEVLISNQLASSESPAPLSINRGAALYTFQGGEPNLVTDQNFPWRAYTSVLNITVMVDDVGYEWKPVGDPGDLAFEYPEATLHPDDAYFRGYVLGANQVEGSDFITNGPNVVDMILRDPPGSESYSFLEKGTTFSFEQSLSTHSSLTSIQQLSILAGTEFSTGLGYTTTTDIDMDANIGFNSTTSWSSDRTLTQRYTTTESWKTSASPELAGAASDLFFGSSKNYRVSLADELTLVPAGFADSTGLPTAGSEAGGHVLGVKQSLLAAPEGTATHFIYTADHIENDLIPNLIAIRNNLFINDPAYSSNLPAGHPLYGSNNDDPRWGDQATTDDPVNTDRDRDYEGPSYNYVPQEYVENDRGEMVPKHHDKIRKYNQQIRLWREALERNEMEKYHAELIKNISYDAGPTFEQSTETSLTQSHTYSFESTFNMEVTTGIGTEIAGIGVDFTNGISFDYSTGNTTTREKTETNTFGYVLHDPDQGDYFSVDVKDAGTGTGPVFLLKGGRSMCPREEATPVNYYEPSKHQVTNSTVADLSAMFARDEGDPAIEELFLQMLSNTETREVTFDELKGEFTISEAIQELIPGDAVFELEQIRDREFSNKLSLAEAVTGFIDLRLDMTLEENEGLSDDVAGNMEEMDESDLKDVSDQIEMNESNGFDQIYLFTAGQRSKLQKLWARYRKHLYDITAEPVFGVDQLGSSTIRREVPTLEITPALQTNVPDDNLAYFTLQMGNNSYTNETMFYEAKVLESTNPDGAIIKLDGLSVNRVYEIPPGSQINKTLSVAMGKPDIYEYDSIQIVLYSMCEYEYYANGRPLDQEAIDTVTFSVRFIPSCTDITIASPDNDFIINSEDEHLVNGVRETRVPILMTGYDLNNSIFEKLNFQFKPAASPDWIKTDDFHLVAGDDQQEIPGEFTAIEWDLSGYPDGEYDIRAKTYCGNCPDGSEIFDLSEVWTGVVDRKPPEVFGTPQPADGILAPDDDIVIEFNEDIQSEKLSKLANFDIRGILNGSELRHDVSVRFDDNTGDYVRIPDGINLAGKSFTIEFWMKSERSHVRECIFSQHTNPENALAISLTGDGNVEFQVGDQVYTADQVNTSGIIGSWHHWAFVFDRVREEALVLRDGYVVGSGSMDPAYTGYGDVYLGKSMINDGDPFKGSLHELRIWERPRTASGITANMLVTLSGKETGLIGYWPFSDATGPLATEKVHRRNASVHAPWMISPTGYAATFDANAEGMLDLDFSDVAFGEEEDFTIEFWFKGDQGAHTCLLSNGHGDQDDVVLYYYSPEDLAYTAAVLPLEDDVESILEPMVNDIFASEEAFLSRIGELFGQDKAEQYEEQLLRFGTHMPTYWCINTDGSGNIQVSNNSKRIKTEGVETFDNRWHHFALVVQRVGNTRLYIDGELEISEPSTEWNGFGAARLFVGARGLFNQEVAGFEFDQYFNGSIDELRIWNTAVKQDQLQRNRAMRLDGDELGLAAYLPFESFVEIMGADPVIDGMTGDILSPGRTVSANTGVMTQASDVPNVRMKRPSSKVDFDFVAKDDRIAFVINEPSAKVENCILDITAQNVEDMHGNKMSSPVTWSAYVDRNQVKWGDQEFNLEKELYAAQTFTTRIINHSGEQQFYTIENIPSWATVDRREGTIEPLSEKEVTFTINEGVNVGTFSKDISLKTDFGFDEKLKVSLRVYDQLPSDWKVSPEDYEYSMNVIGYLSINQVISADPHDQVAAFIDGECRGIGNLTYVEEYDRYEVFLDVYSNQVSDEYVEFFVWDASTGREYRRAEVAGLRPAPENYPDAYEFLDNAVYGSPSEPAAIEVEQVVIQKISLHEGWNWKSFNIQMDQSQPLSHLLEGMTPEEGDMIKGIDRYSEYSSYWIGTLHYPEPEQMYMVRLANDDTLKVSGVPVDPKTTPIPVVEGWNWIGYTPQVNMTTGEALGLFTPNDGDLIKSQFAFAMYDELMGWVGTLDYLRPNEGYKYRYTPVEGAPSAQDLYFPVEGTMLKSAARREAPAGPADTTFRSYPANMSVVAEIENLPGDAQDTGDELVLRDADQHLRGRVHPVEVSGRSKPLYFITAMGDVALTDSLYIHYVSSSDEQVMPVREAVFYQAGEVLGDPDNPVALTVDRDERSPLAGMGEESISVYPNPFGDEVTLEVTLPEKADIRIELVSVMGRSLFQEVYSGRLFARERIATAHYSPGVYLLKVTVNGHTVTRKVIKR